MRAVVQRVLEGRVEVDGETVSSIGPGLLCLVGLGRGDTKEDQDYICRKLLNARLYHNEEKGKDWDLSVKQKEYELLLVSQFTLLGEFKGNKPEWKLAMPPGEAREMYQEFVDKVKAAYLPSKVKDGIFGAKMEVSLINDGPVTVILNSSRGRSTTSMRASSFKPLQKRTRCFFRSGYRCIRSTRLFALTM